MKWIYRLFTFGMLATVIIVPFFLDTKNGKPMLTTPTLDDFIPDKLVPDSLIPGKQATSESTPISDSAQTFYKWQDKQGNWHYGDQPPPGSHVSTLQVDTNTNIIQSLKIEPEEEEAPALGQAPQQTLPERLTSGELTLDNALNIMDDAKSVRDMMESRNDQLKAIAGE